MISSMRKITLTWMLFFFHLITYKIFTVKGITYKSLSLLWCNKKIKMEKKGRSWGWRRVFLRLRKMNIRLSILWIEGHKKRVANKLLFLFYYKWMTRDLISFVFPSFQKLSPKSLISLFLKRVDYLLTYNRVV